MAGGKGKQEADTHWLLLPSVIQVKGMCEEHPQLVIPAERLLRLFAPSRNLRNLSSCQTCFLCSAANPFLKPVPVLGLTAEEHTSGPSRIVTLDLSKQLGIDDYAATSPNLLASFVRVCTRDAWETASCSTFQVGHRCCCSLNGISASVDPVKCALLVGHRIPTTLSFLDLSMWLDSGGYAEMVSGSAKPSLST